MKTPSKLFGLSFRPNHYHDLLSNGFDEIDLLEIITENYLELGSLNEENFLDDLSRRKPIILHGVGLSLSSSDPLNKDYLNKVRSLSKRIKPLMISDHLSWTSYRGINSHDLLPMTYTHETLKLVTSKVLWVQDFLGQKLYLENPSAYIAFDTDSMEESEFLGQLCINTGCGILLDINNLYVVHRNLGVDPTRYISHLKTEWLGYFHIAGHTDIGDALVDTHDKPVSEGVWNLFKKIVAWSPTTPTVIEWDGEIPSLKEVLSEILKAKRYHTQSTTTSRESNQKGEFLPSKPQIIHHKNSHFDWESIQSLFFKATTQEHGDQQAEIIKNLHLRDNLPTPKSLGLKIYRDAYWTRLIKIMNQAYPVLHRVLGKDYFSLMIKNYLQIYPPSDPDIMYIGKNLSEYLRVKVLPLPCPAESYLLSELASLEWAKFDLRSRIPIHQYITLSELASIPSDEWAESIFVLQTQIYAINSAWEIGRTIDAFEKGEYPPIPLRKKSYYIVYRSQESQEILEITDQEWKLLEHLSRELPFQTALEKTKTKTLSAKDIQEGVTFLTKLCTKGLIHHVTKKSLSI